MPDPKLIASLLILLCGSAAAQPATGDAYQAGLACYEQLDYACAVDLLTAAAYAADGSDLERWCDIHRKLAESQLALGRSDRAVDAFARLLTKAPDYRLDQPGTSPKIRAALDRARQQQERRSPPAPRPPPAPEAGNHAAPQERAIRFGLAGGAEFLVGEDERLLQIGPVVDLGLTYRYAENWALGGGLRWTRHAMDHADRAVHLVGGWAGGGPSVALGPIRLTGLVGFGVARFWVPGDDGATALLVPVNLTVDFAVHDRIVLGLTFSPSWLLRFGDFESSLTLDVSAALAAHF